MIEMAAEKQFETSLQPSLQVIRGGGETSKSTGQLELVHDEFADVVEAPTAERLKKETTVTETVMVQTVSLDRGSFYYKKGSSGSSWAPCPCCEEVVKYGNCGGRNRSKAKAT